MPKSRVAKSKRQYVQGINSPAKLLAAQIKGAVGAPKPGFVEPSLATLWPKPPNAAALMKPVGEDVLQKWPVSKRVNSSRADDGDPMLIDRDDGVIDRTAIVATMHAIARRIGNSG